MPSRVEEERRADFARPPARPEMVPSDTLRALRALFSRLIGVFGSLPARPLKISIGVDRASYPRGETIHGTVTIGGGTHDQKIKGVALAVSEYAGIGEAARSNPLLSLNLSDGFRIGPGKEAQFPFSFRIPNEIQVSEVDRSGSPTSGLLLTVQALLGDGGVRDATHTLYVHLEPGMQAVMEAMRTLGFVAASWHDRQNRGVIHRRFRVTGGLAQWIGSASLQMGIQSGQMHGRLTLFRAPGSVSERVLLAFVEQAGVELPIGIPYSDLVTVWGKPNPNAAMPHLQRALTASMLVGDEARNNLLRPSSAPIGDLLLHPATSIHDNSADLLRSACPPDDEEADDADGTAHLSAS